MQEHEENIYPFVQPTVENAVKITTILVSATQKGIFLVGEGSLILCDDGEQINSS